MIIPSNKPKLNQAEALDIVEKMVDDVIAPMLVGLRGYYKRTMGDPEKNDRDIYDDAIILLTPNVYATFNANTDPSVTRPKVANLKEGVWLYQLGMHGYASRRPYPALVQAGPVTVIRDQKGEDTGWFGINIHRGGRNTTSSLGCQTIYPDQWDSFYSLVKSEMNRSNQTIITYTLINL